MRKKKYNLENRKHFVYFAIIYTCICVTVMAFTVFFQYRAYTKNYNATVAKLCALIHEKYPDVSDGSIAAILNDSKSSSVNTACTALFFRNEQLCKCQGNGNSLFLHAGCGITVLQPFPRRISGCRDIGQKIFESSLF